MTDFPEARIMVLRPAIEAHLKEAAAQVGGEAFNEYFDLSTRALLVDGFRRAGAQEGTVWMLDREREFLVPRFNSGPHAKEFVGIFRQSLRAGMVSMVVATEQPICENDMCRNRQHDASLDQKLNLQTCAMLAVPFYFMSEVRGVISCVQLKQAGSEAPDPPGFSPGSLRGLQLNAGLLSRLIEHRLLALCLGLEGIV